MFHKVFWSPLRYNPLNSENTLPSPHPKVNELFLKSLGLIDSELDRFLMFLQPLHTPKCSAGETINQP
jgi:hypothetical protein